MKKKTRKENPRRSLILFLLLLFISMIIGGIGGGLMANQQKSVKDILQTVFGWMEQGSGWAAVVVTVVGMAASAGVYLRCRREAKAWDGEDETYIERVENWPSASIRKRKAIRLILISRKPGWKVVTSRNR